MSSSTGKAILGLLLTLSLFFPPLLKAAEITLEPRIGFHGLFQLGNPFPVWVDLRNSGRPVEGNLEVKVWKGGPARGQGSYAFYYHKEIFLPAQSRKTVHFTIDPDSVSKPLVVTFSSQGLRWSREIDLRRHFSPSPLILLLTGGSVFPTLPLGAASSSRLVALTLDDLPPDARAYRGVSTLIVYEQSLRDLSKPQLSALETWLSAGGKFLVLGSINYALYQDPTISRFLPVRVTGLKKFSTLPSLERLQRRQGSQLRDVWAQESRPVSGKVLIEEQGTPILVEMGRGRGKISYLSLDVGRPPLSRWDGLSLLFNDLVGPSSEGGLTLRVNWNEGVFSQLLLSPSFVSTYVPTQAFFLALLLYLGGLGLLARFWQRRRFPRRTLAFGFIGFVVLTSYGGHLYFSRGGHVPDGVLLSSTLLESIPGGYAEAQTNVALFSTQMREYDLQVGSGWIDVEPVPLRSARAEDPDVVVKERGDSTVFRFPLREWSYRLFKVRYVTPFPIYTEVHDGGDKIVFKLNNQSGKDLSECWLVVSGQRFSLGDIPRGAHWTREFPVRQKDTSLTGRLSGSADKGNLQEISFKDKSRELLFRYSFLPQNSGMEGWGSRGVLFFGWVQSPSRRAWVEDVGMLAYDHTLFRTVFPLDLGEEGEL